MHTFFAKELLMNFSIHFQAGIRGILAVGLCDSDVLGDGVIDSEAHGVLHLPLNAASVGKDEDDVDEDENGDDEDQHLGTHSIRSDNLGLLVADVLFLVEIEADLGLDAQVSTDIFEDVLGGDVSTEGLLIDSNRWPVKCAVFLPCFRVCF